MVLLVCEVPHSKKHISTDSRKATQMDVGTRGKKNGEDREQFTSSGCPTSADAVLMQCFWGMTW